MADSLPREHIQPTTQQASCQRAIQHYNHALHFPGVLEVCKDVCESSMRHAGAQSTFAHRTGRRAISMQQAILILKSCASDGGTDYMPRMVEEFSMQASTLVLVSVDSAGEVSGICE